MCLAVPGKILAIDDDENGVPMARTSFGGIVKNVCLVYTPDARPDDYVLVHVGFAIGVVDEIEAERTLRTLESLGHLDELSGNEEAAAVGNPNHDASPLSRSRES